MIVEFSHVCYMALHNTMHGTVHVYTRKAFYGCLGAKVLALKEVIRAMNLLYKEGGREERKEEGREEVGKEGKEVGREEVGEGKEGGRVEGVVLPLESHLWRVHDECSRQAQSLLVVVWVNHAYVCTQ